MTYQDDTAATDNIVDDASRAPEILMDGSLGRLEDSTREPGLILTKEQIKNIKLYEMAGLALPIEIGAVIGYLGYNEGEGAGKGLEPKDFQKTFTLINSHARTWNPLRTDLIAVTSRLQLFAGDIQNNGITMEDIYSDVRALRKLEGYDIRTLEDIRKLKDELGDRLKEFNLDAADKSTVSQFTYFLDNILDAVNRQQAEAADIKKRLDKFSGDLAEKVLPEIKIKIATINNSNLADLIKELSTDIEERAKKIEELNAAYKKAVRSALEAASKLNIVGLAVSIYTGIEAEKIRKERNDERKIQQLKIAEMRTKDKVLASLHRVRSDLQDLDIIVVDADIATKNLVTVWNKITLFIDRSKQGVSAINDALSLYQFMDHFRSVVRPWETIGRDAELLYEVFDQADKEFREEYGPKSNMQRRSVLFMSAPLILEEPDMKAMRDAKAACHSKMVDANVHHTETDYLPSVFAKFHNLNDALNKAHTGFTASVEKIFYDLEFPIDDILRYQEELADADEEDREYILSRISDLQVAATTDIGKETQNLASHLKSISEPFNRESTLKSLDGLNIQAAKLPEDIDALNERKSTLQGELQTLNSAIQAIESKGFADIGEETILNAEALAALQLAGPHAAAVKVALDLLQKSLADLDAALNYFGLLSLRKNLRTRLDAETQKISNKNDEVRMVEQRTRLINAFHGFDDERVNYAQEYSKVVTSFKSFVNKHASTPKDGDEFVEQWIEDAKALIDYLPRHR
jgi:hypothetical protein